jgi:MFS family permease
MAILQGETKALKDASAQGSAWSPLSHTLFRWIWIAAVASNIGTWMQNVGAEWLMTSIAPSPMMVALMQTAEMTPLFLLALPAGALADVVDRRRLLLITQGWMLVAAATLALLTLAGVTGAWTLLLLTFALGLGAALNAPAWQAIVPELVPRSELAAAVSLNSVAFNIARALGPALGGVVVAFSGPWAVFLLNAFSFLGILLVLYRWRREPSESMLPTERVVGAMRAGLRYVRHSPELRTVLLRTGIFVFCASALWAMLPLIARRELGLGAVAYGILLGGLGAGAVLAAFLLPVIRRRISINLLVVCGTALFAGVTLTLAYVRVMPLLALAMVLGGIAWMALMSSFNISVQTVVPTWVRARALAIYLLVFFGGMAIGSAIWGAVATHLGIPTALLCAALAMLAGLFAALRYPLAPDEGLDLNPSLHWSEPTVISEPHPLDGPVLVTIEYSIDPARADEFREAMDEMKRILRRDGAMRWGLFKDQADERRYLETFLVESWAEHMRQHARVTNADRAIQDHARSFHTSDAPPVVTHMIAENVSTKKRRIAASEQLENGASENPSSTNL